MLLLSLSSLGSTSMAQDAADSLLRPAELILRCLRTCLTRSWQACTLVALVVRWHPYRFLTGKWGESTGTQRLPQQRLSQEHLMSRIAGPAKVRKPCTPALNQVLLHCCHI